MKSAFILGKNYLHTIYSEETKKTIEHLSNSLGAYDKEYFLTHLHEFKDLEIIFSGWDPPTLTKEVLDQLPHLKVVFYGAGTIKHLVTPAFFKRHILVTNAATVNAIPVAEYTFSQILLSLKNQYRIIRKIREDQTYHSSIRDSIHGVKDAKIGIISLSAISKKLIHLLSLIDVKVYVSSDHLDQDKATALNVEKISLEEMFRICDVVSLHSALNERTENSIRAHHFLSMKKHATFINTARGKIVCEKEMIEALKERSDITALLDVTVEEPPVSPDLYTMDNVFLTPHIAGSLGTEIYRMGDLMLEEFTRYLNNEPLQHSISEEQFKQMA